jgi:arabinofuranosyltransferase
MQDNAAMQDASVRARRLCIAALCILACLSCYAGWKLYWFLTDDAFIAFRYIGNRQLGHGYTWNPPPFLPVEGYTSFLWVVVLDAIWAVLGVEPPDSANVVSLLCSLASLLLVAVWVVTRFASVARGWALPWLLFWTLALVVSHRNFLVWTSSGLEAALFNLLVLSWVLLAYGLGDAPRRDAPRLALVALLISLARPDGLLYWAATIALLLLLALRRALPRRALVYAGLPLVGTLLHLGWRRAHYGNWLPNTYYAKVTGIWPEAGLRYLAAYVLEYALWLWLPVVVLACIRAVRAHVRAAHDALSVAALARVIACGALLAHAAYYVLIVGGDHFEFRVFSQLVPLMALAFVWAANALLRAPWAGALCAALLALGSVIPWTHFLLTRELATRAETAALVQKVAPALPQPLAALARPFDTLQAWLIERSIGRRHQEHKIFQQWQASLFPTRARGLAMKFRQPNPVLVYPCVGIPGWTLPRVYVLDSLGLNDHVIARTPPQPGERRAMAHERSAPPGYLAAFMPDVQFDDAVRPNRLPRLIELVRPQPLTAARIVEIERRYRTIVDAP